MTDLFKSRIEDWLRLLTASIAASAIVGGSLWFVIESKGNDIWARKETVENLIAQQNQIKYHSQLHSQKDEDHRDNEDIHMSSSEKSKFFVPRPEMELIISSLTRQMEALSAQIKNSKDEVAVARSEQKLNWERQRDFNEELIREVSKKRR